jgi:hypothetical protein
MDGPVRHRAVKIDPLTNPTAQGSAADAFDL